MTDNRDAAVELNKLALDLSAASGQPFKAVAVSLVTEGARQVETYARAYSPVKTGFNRDAIVTETNGLSATVTATSGYSRPLEYGTGTRGEFPGRPIVIKARPGGVLAFKGRDGTMVFVKQVTSQGMAPRPFMRPALERVAWPVASNFANAAVIFITQGPKSLSGVTHHVDTNAEARGRADAEALVQTGVNAAANYHTARKAFT